MLHIENKVKNMGIEAIRLDAFTLNPYAVKMYIKLGFEKVGIANFRKGKFYLMEKKV
jgi:ribosomal protein S18 acetylase RimI-like enzyme